MNELSKIIVDYYKDKDQDINDILLDLDKAKIDIVRYFLENSADDKAYVIKRSGNLEEYTEDKIRRSIKNAADNKNQHLNTSDLDIIMDDVSDHMKEEGRKVFKTDEIKYYVKNALKNEGYSQIHDSYDLYIQG